MQKKLKLAVLALCSSSMVAAQNTDTGKQGLSRKEVGKFS